MDPEQRSNISLRLTSPFSWDARHTYSFLLCLSGTVCGIPSINPQNFAPKCVVLCWIQLLASGHGVSAHAYPSLIVSSFSSDKRKSVVHLFPSLLAYLVLLEIHFTVSFHSRLINIGNSSVERRASPSPLRHQHKLLCAFLLPSSKK